VKPDAPIGIFDSGVGGLTVARAIRQALPEEHLIYLGDTARVPYGNKSAETVVRYAREDAAFLCGHGVKCIVVACNTASAYALEALKDEFSVPVMGVIEPGIEAALAAASSRKIGIIGTVGTIGSGAYQSALQDGRSGLDVRAVATPLLVPLVEEGRVDGPVARMIVEDYLQPLLDEGMDTLVLACTHYPLLLPLLEEMVGDRVQLIDSASTCANRLKHHLGERGERRGAGEEGRLDLYLTDVQDHSSGFIVRFLGPPAPVLQLARVEAGS